MFIKLLVKTIGYVAGCDFGKIAATKNPFCIWDQNFIKKFNS